MNDEKQIYSMNLHEMIIVGEISHSLATVVLRVPGGWVYSQFDKSHNMSSSVFVPFDNEYMKERKND